MSKNIKAKNLERLDKFLTEQKTTEILKEREYSTRRDKKIQRKREIEKDRKLLYFKYLYIPSIIGIMSGTVLIFGSTIRTVSEGSIFWAHRQALQVLGPILLGLGIVFLLLSVGLINRREKQMSKLRGYNFSNSLSMGTSVCNSIESMTMSRQSSIRSSCSGFSRASSRECRYARLKNTRWKNSTDLFDSQLLVKCVAESRLKQEKFVEKNREMDEVQKQENGEEQNQLLVKCVVDSKLKQDKFEELNQKNEEQKQDNDAEQNQEKDEERNQLLVKCFTNSKLKQEKDAEPNQKKHVVQNQIKAEKQNQEKDEVQNLENGEEEKHKKNVEQNQEKCEEHNRVKQKDERQKQRQDPEKIIGTDSEASQKTDRSSISDFNITNEYITEVWIKRSDLCADDVGEQRTSGRQNIGGINKKNFVKMSVHSGMETKIGSRRTKSLGKPSVENKMSCQIYIE